MVTTTDIMNWRNCSRQHANNLIARAALTTGERVDVTADGRLKISNEAWYRHCLLKAAQYEAEAARWRKAGEVCEPWPTP